jgi:signal transduction histidine kinase
LEPSNRKNGRLKRAELFFSEALTPIVETHRAARQSRTHLSRLKAALGQRTEELAATNRQLQRGIIRRKVMEETAGQIGHHHQKCLEESLQLQKRLRQLTHRVLAGQEAERRNISQELQNEIAQTLLGINVRLLSLKSGIATTKQLVATSVRCVRRFAREFGSL